MSFTDQIHKLRAFYALAKAGNFSRAAELLGITQPAVSLQVKGLEAEYGIPLLSRKGRRISLTPAGQTVYDYLQRIFALAEEMDNALQNLKGLRAGRLVVGASTTLGEFVLPTIMGHFHRLYPDVEIKLEIANTTTIVQRVARHQLDLGFVGDRPDDPTLRAETFVTDHIVLFASPENPLSARDTIAPADLGSQKLILREDGSATRRYALQALAKLGIEIPVAMELGSNVAVKQAVGANLGIGALSSYALASELATGALKLLNVLGWECVRDLNVIYPAAKPLGPAEEAFLKLARQAARADPPIPIRKR